MRAVSPHAVIGGVIALVVAGAVTAGLAVIGSPSEARLERLDARRIQDLQTLSRRIDVYWVRHGKLPSTLDAVSLESPATAPRDPVSGQPYEFRAAGEKRYELCATFDRRSTGTAHGLGEELWAHGAGRGCFPLEVKAPPRS